MRKTLRWMPNYSHISSSPKVAVKLLLVCEQVLLELEADCEQSKAERTSVGEREEFPFQDGEPLSWRRISTSTGLGLLANNNGIFLEWVNFDK